MMAVKENRNTGDPPRSGCDASGNGLVRVNQTARGQRTELN